MAETAKSGDGRWWEFYAVRYAMGTVIGAIVVFVLARRVPAAGDFLLGKDPITGLNLTPTQLGLFAAFGLVYCYIASAPILVFHSGRFLFDGGRSPRSLFLCLKVAVGILVACGLAAVLLLLVMPWQPANFLTFVGAFLTVVVLLTQYAVVIASLMRPGKMAQFAFELAERRGEAVGGVVDSYRHLREHGNSFFIAVLELLLGVALYVVTTNVNSAMSGVLLALLAWSVPAVLVWLVGTLFEREFAARALQPKASSKPHVEITVREQP